MIEQRSAVFLLNLIQDVNVLRPLMIMARRDFGFRVVILVSPKFRGRDLYGIWEAEIELLRAETDARVLFYRTELQAFRELEGRGGIIFSASESSLWEHDPPHAVFRYAPASFLKVTLQHGFECVGFKHSAAHDLAYGTDVSFAADIVCTWQPPELQSSLLPSQRPKVEVTGPTSVLQAFAGPLIRAASAPGLVGENLHSVRLTSTPGAKGQFVQAFEAFCGLLAEDGRNVILRPHPGGQYSVKNGLALPPNASINNAPMYRLDMRQFAYGISAPSSVLIDMLLAEIPTAVWKDKQGVEAANYDGLTQISDPKEWYEFARQALADPAPFVETQRRFLEAQRMPLEPAEVFARHARLFEAAKRIGTKPRATAASQRLLLVANAHLPTVQVCLERPLQPLVTGGEIVSALLTERRLKDEQQRLGSPGKLIDWLNDAMDEFAADVLIFSRYSGPYSQVMVEWAMERGVPIIYHIDDNLLAVPRSLGEAKHAYHNAPERLAAVQSLLREADVIYASTEALREQLLEELPDLTIVAGAINASGVPLKEPPPGPARIIGYMASADHSPNLEMVLPAIIAILDRHPNVSFELFGSIPAPDDLLRFGDRVRKVEPVPDYKDFLKQLCSRGWHIGICPLVPTRFNKAKSNNKWIEYTAAGIAVIASAGMVYDDSASGGCALLATGLDEWERALESLLIDDASREMMVERAQRKLVQHYSPAQHRRQVVDVIKLATERAAARSKEEIG